MNNSTSMKVETYQMTASNGRPIRKATKVTDVNGRTIRFLERLPKGVAIDAAAKAWNR